MVEIVIKHEAKPSVVWAIETAHEYLYERTTHAFRALINPRGACAARVTSVCVSVCVSVRSHLTYGASVRPENAVTYSTGKKGQRICGALPETTAFKSYARSAFSA